MVRLKLMLIGVVSLIVLMISCAGKKYEGRTARSWKSEVDSLEYYMFECIEYGNELDNQLMKLIMELPIGSHKILIKNTQVDTLE